MAQERPSVVYIGTPGGTGTGVIYETRGQTAYVLTAWHVIDGFDQVTIQVKDSDDYEGKVLGYDAWRDLAVVEICCGDFRTMAVRGSQTTIKPGAEVVSIGYALGFEGPATVTRGIVSAYRYAETYRSWVIQTDAPINPGNSGGPLLLANGEFIGINSFYYARQEAEGLGFAISKQTVQSVIEGLKSGTKVDFPTPTPLPTPTPAVKHWQTHVNVSYGYSMKVPQGWTLKGKSTDKLSFRSSDGKAYGGLTISPTTFDSAYDDMTSWLDYRADQNPAVFQLIDVSGDANGASSYYRYQDSSEYCIEEAFDYMWIRGGKEYYLYFGVCENSADKYTPVLDQVYTSLEWR